MQIWVSGYELHRNDQVTPACLLRNTAPDMICIDVMWIWCSIASWNHWTHSGQVWVSGYKLYWNNQIVATSINTWRDMMWNDVRSTLCGIAHLNDWIIMGRYEFQWNNAFRIVRCHPYWGIHCQRCCALIWCGFYVALPLKVIGPTVSRYEFQVIKPIGIMRWRLCWWIHYPVSFVLM